MCYPARCAEYVPTQAALGVAVQVKVYARAVCKAALRGPGDSHMQNGSFCMWEVDGTGHLRDGQNGG